IARPFKGRKAGAFVRSPHRRDFSMEPAGNTVLDVLKAAGKDVLGVGKIEDVTDRLIDFVKRFNPDATVQLTDVNGGEIEKSYGE
ncbi:hypothetical protein J6S46_03290, partial [Candidatus Saccharibacteria bacterium]|nr:hypothetical protein [Candidatus Saccharibacteria bacterium]